MTYVSCRKCQTMPETIRSVKIWGRGSSLNCQKVFWALCVAPATPPTLAHTPPHPHSLTPSAATGGRCRAECGLDYELVLASAILGPDSPFESDPNKFGVVDTPE